MKKIYIVPVVSNVTADYHVLAANEADAEKFVAAAMKESIERLEKKYAPHDCIKNRVCKTWTIKAKIRRA